ncbi:MAG: hypothetical protein EOO04_31865 [Chitinophagaceae bacterium]|nr:MAG: hypothetical protein EOO04_31865 [Chitinophagaceae bacterium]
MNDLDPAKNKLTKKEIDRWLLRLPVILEEMTKTMDLITFLLSTKKAACRPVGQIQKECVGLLDAIEKLPVHPESKRQDAKDIFRLRKATVKCIEDILVSIESTYKEYMDWDIRMPQAHLMREASEVRTNMDIIVAGFRKNKIDGELQNATCYCMKEVTRLRQVKYGRMRFVQRLQMVLLEMLEGNKCDNDYVCNLLYRENYNHNVFLACYQKLITQELSEICPESRYELINRYRWAFEKPTYCKKATQYDINARKCHYVMYEFVIGELRGCKHSGNCILILVPFFIMGH